MSSTIRTQTTCIAGLNACPACRLSVIAHEARGGCFGQVLGRTFRLTLSIVGNSLPLPSGRSGSHTMYCVDYVSCFSPVGTIHSRRTQGQNALLD